MIKINDGIFEVKGFEKDVVYDCMCFIHALNVMIENNEIEIDKFCSLDVQELQKFAQHMTDGIKQFMAEGDSNV